MIRVASLFTARKAGLLYCVGICFSLVVTTTPVHATAIGPTFIQTTASTTKTKITFLNPVAAGDLLVAGITTNDGGTDPVTGVSDNLNGAWNKATSLRYGNGHVELYYRGNSAGGVVTVTFAGSQSVYGLAEYSGVLASPTPLDQYASKAATGSPSAGPTAPTATANELVIGIGGNPAPSSTPSQFTAGTGFTLRTQAVAPFVSAVGLEDSLSSSNAGQSMTMKSANSSYYGAIVAVFRTVPAPAPKAALSVNPSSGPNPLAVTADASASTDPIGITSYTFAFGDGAVAGPQVGATAFHTYSAGGRFTAQVTIADSAGATSTANAAVSVGAPVAALSLNPTTAATGAAVTADASASTDPIGISSYTFNFGDGGPPVGPQAAAVASHAYTAAGVFSVTVTVSDSVAASGTATTSVAIVAPPNASLAVLPAGGAAPLAVAVDASTSSPGSNPIATYTFDFGDLTSTGPQALSAVSHTYASGGLYTLKVTVTDTAGYSGNTTQMVTVGQPAAALSVAPAAGGVPLTVTANASASSDPIGISSYTFNFGDGSATVGPQAAATANHTYASGGGYVVVVTIKDSTGAASSASTTVLVGAPVAAVTVSPLSGAAPLAVTADASASTDPVAISTYTFDFGDGTVVGPQSGATASHTYTAGGNYTLRVTVTDAAGASSSASRAVAIGAPNAAVKVTPSSGGAPLNVTADASASSDPIGISSYTFNFGDGSAAVGPQAIPTASHTYASTGAFTVTVTVRDSVGGSASASNAVTVAAPPTAALTVSPASAPVGATITADASLSTAGTNPIASYTFDFGDGSRVGPQAGATATHAFSAGGTYIVAVTVSDTIGVSAIATVIVTATAPPTAALTLSPSYGAFTAPVSADASASKAGSQPIASYAFNFGDGATVGPGASATVTHIYSAPGTYTVTLTVTDTGGTTATASVQVTVVAAPNAAVSVSPGLGATPLTVAADASGSTPGTNPIATYTFVFGDGTTVGPQAGALASHVYVSAGSYTVTIIVTDSKNISASATAAVTAVAPPRPHLTLTPPSGGVPLPVTMDGSTSTPGSNPIATYAFGFGDGSVPSNPSATPSTTHTYSGMGTFTVTLTVTDSMGISAIVTARVTVVNPPSAVLVTTPSSGGAPLRVTADASGSTDPIGISSYTFDFGDGSPLVGPQAAAIAVHVFTTAGNFTVTVTVTDVALATATATAAADVVAPPAAAVSENPISGYAPLSVIANAAASGAGSFPIASYTFDFGDGTAPVGPQAGASTSHIYVNPGTFTTVVSVTDTQGNVGTASATITATSGVLGQDSFTRANQSGWGTASNGVPWAPTGPSLSVSGNEGVVSNSASSAYETLGNATTADGNALVRFSVASTTNTAGIILRAQSNGNIYLARYDGAGHLQFEYRIGTSWTHVSLVPFTPTVNSFYWLRFQVQGTSVNLKAWANGASEPSAWNWSGTSSGITGAGQMGLYAYAGTATPVKFDSFSVSAVGNPVPNSTIAGTVIDGVDGSPIAGVQVSTLPLTTTATTSSLGTYLLNLPTGTFTVVFTGSSFGYNTNFISGVQAPLNGTVSANESLTPIPAQTAMDTFTQPNQSNGFGTSTDGNVWASDLGVYPGAQAGITGSQAWVDTQASSQTDFDTWMGYQYQDQQVSVDLNMSTILVDPVYQHGARLLARVQNSTTWVLMSINPTAQDLELWVALNNNWTELAFVSQPISTNTWYHAKLTVGGNTVQGKIWTFGTAEPGWLITASQRTLNGPGQGGLRTTGAYVQYANFQQTPITRISGVVTSATTGGPVASATVSLSNGAITTTDAAGSYSFSGLLGSATYTLTASGPGFKQSSIQVIPQAGTTTAVNISLSP